MIFFDSHCHLENEQFKGEIEQVLHHMQELGVDKCICAGSDMQTSAQILDLTKKHEPIYGTVGIHPHEAKFFKNEDLQTLANWQNEAKIVGIGEIGLDYYYNHSEPEVQKDVLKKQIELAIDLDVPLMFHVRDAHGDMLDIVKRYNIKRGVMHCFSGSIEIAKEYLKRGFIISFAGPLTFKNAAKLPDIAAMVPEDRYFIETDSPYLAPVPFRGKRNEPAYVVEVAKKIAEIKNMRLEDVAAQSYKNICSFYDIQV